MARVYPRVELGYRNSSFDQGAKWKTLIGRYIGTIPVSGDASPAGQGIAGMPLS